ncbi:hypothetical protein QP209_23550, partial [Escherichia coli]|nr:hypothetical protein [Escherichia coli]
PSISDGRLSYQFSSDGYIRRSVYAYDFTNFYEDLMNNQKIPDSGVLTQKVKEQIADQLKQAGQ